MTEQCAGAASSVAPCNLPAPGQRAARAFTMPTSRSAVQGLHKAEVAQLLTELGLPYSPAWGVDELKQILKENMFPKDESAAQRELKGLGTMKKGQLLAKAEEVGAHTTPGMTKPSLKLAIRKAVTQKSEPEPTDILGFGKHGALTYQQVLSQYPTYAAWCKTEVSAESSWELVRFVSWLTEQEKLRAKQGMTKDPKEVLEPPKARGGARSSRRRTADAIMEDEAEELEKKEAAAQEEKKANQLVQQQMLTALNQLSQRLERLEAQPSSAGSFEQVDSSRSGRAED